MGWLFFICGSCTQRDVVDHTAFTRPASGSLLTPSSRPVLHPPDSLGSRPVLAPEAKLTPIIQASLPGAVSSSPDVLATSVKATSSIGRSVIDASATGAFTSRSFPLVEEKNPTGLISRGNPIARVDRADKPSSSSGSGAGAYFIEHPVASNRLYTARSTRQDDCSAISLTSPKSAMAIDALAASLTQSSTDPLNAYEALLRALSGELRLSLELIGETRALFEVEATKPCQRVLVDAFDSSLRKLHRLSDEIRDLDHHESKFELKNETFNLDVLRDQLISQMGPLASKADLTLMFDSWNIKGFFYGDPHWISQILINFISNAIKYSPTGEGIRVSLETRILENEHQRLHFAVHNKGPTLSLDQQSHLFKHFSQVGRSAEGLIGGLGLGLAFCKVLVEKMNPFSLEDSIGVRSTVEEGTTFWFDIELPYRKGSDPRSFSACASSDTAASLPLASLRTPCFKRELPVDVTEAEDAKGVARSSHSDLLTYYIHELRTPLQGLLLSLSELKEESTLQQLPVINKITTCCKGLSSLIDTFLDYKKCLEGEVKLSISEFRWSELVDCIIASTREFLGERDQSLEFSLLEELKLPDGCFRADRRKLSDAITHLLHYASLQSPLSAQLRLKVHLQNTFSNSVRLLVYVEAPLSPKTLLATLFLPPVESELISKGFHPYIAAHLLSLMNPPSLAAGVGVRAGVGAGAGSAKPIQSCYGIEVCEDGYLSLWGSLTVEAVEKRLPPTPSAFTSIPRDKPLDGMRVLIVEDDNTTVQLISRCLQRAGCQTCLRAASLSEVLAILPDTELRTLSHKKVTSTPEIDAAGVMGELVSLERAEVVSDSSNASSIHGAASQLPCDLILLDKHLKYEDGLDVARELRTRKGDERDLPIIVTTGSASPGLIEICRREGISAVLAKPVEFQQLIELAVRLVKTHKVPS